MKSPKAMLIDLDGTIYSGRHALPFASEFTASLHQRGIRSLYVTNNSSRTPEEVARQLRELGIQAEPADICTSAQASAFHIVERGLGRRIYCVGEQGLRTALLDAGLDVIDEDDDGCQVVVQGIDRSFQYEVLKSAVRQIRKGAAYVLTNPDLLLPWNGDYIPGAGALAASIQAATGKEPVVIGKPSPVIMNYALSRLGLKAEEVWVAGDNLATDIAAGEAAGSRTVLVLSGVTKSGEWKERAQASGIQPDCVVRDLKELVHFMDANLV